MRKAFALLLLLSACGSKPDQSGNSKAEPSLNELGVRLPGAPAPEQLQAQAERGLAGVLLDPKDARYSNIRAGSAGAVCGEVDSRQENGRFGRPRPFAVTAEGVAVVSPTTRIRFGDPADLFPDFYIRWCATPEELAKLGPAVATEEPPLDAPQDNAAAMTETSAPPPAAEPPPPPPPEPKAQPKEAPAPSAPPKGRDEDSFFNAVIRKE
jgi:hypothetical protein